MTRRSHRFRQVIFATPFNRTWTPATNASSGTMTSRLLKSVELRPLARSRSAMGERNDSGFNRFSKSRSVRLGFICLSIFFSFSARKSLIAISARTMPLRNDFFAKLRHSSCGQYRVMALPTISCVSSSVSNRTNCWFYWRHVAASKAFSLVAGTERFAGLPALQFAGSD